jgi:hypothetical protein
MESGDVMSKVNRDKNKILEIITLACSRKSMLIFVTPYLRVESGFVGLVNDKVHASVTEGKAEALHSLRFTDMKVRFPHGNSFLEGIVKMVGPGKFDGCQTIVFEMPRALQENDDRRSHRVGFGNVGNVVAKVRVPNGNYFNAPLVDVGVGGARVGYKFADFGKGRLKWGSRVSLVFTIPDVVHVVTEGVVCHVDDGGFGVRFDPSLSSPVAEALASWVFRKREEETGRIDSLIQHGADAAGSEESIDAPKPDKRRVLISTSSNEIEDCLRGPLSSELDVLRCHTSVASVMGMMAQAPHLLILHVNNNNSETRGFLKSVGALVSKNLPILLLASGVEMSLVQELGAECGAVASFGWSRERSLLVQRLIVGILRKHFGLGESPMVSIGS